MSEASTYDAVAVISFGGPEGMEDVPPFLENVLRGKNVPEARKLEVAQHYARFGGVSPLNAQNRALIAALRAELDRSGIRLPIFWGNRNWKPSIAEALREMQAAGVRRALAFFTTGFSSYSSCRQYRENIVAARAEIGPGAPAVDRLRMSYNHPGFIEASAGRVAEAAAELGAADPFVLFTAHSLPSAMAALCAYESQLQETVRLVTARTGHARRRLVFQSRSGPPAQPWLGPDVLEALRALHGQGERAVVIAPVGFLSDHIEVLYDLDTEAKALCDGLGLRMARAKTVGTHPAFVAAIRELIEERLEPGRPRRFLGDRGPWHDVCPIDCCLSGRP
jgi:protoporphyrin/coproporphyrin ferrochelatase